ncbi:hypothetical protein ACMD2_03187 [Ananas comosus]|uniref:Uncharacterized protein n=1 Tax=Ananas comosus TaxID=4615 RepID=A0A199VLE7_ANACO|nr:hypothetical protein ACMD2_03187 [Ananas comosus]
MLLRPVDAHRRRAVERSIEKLALLLAEHPHVLAEHHTAYNVKSEPAEYRPGAELELGGPALDAPRLAVGVEDAGAEEVVEGADEGGDLRVVVEAGFGDVLDGGGVGGEDERGDGDGAGRGGEEELGSPLDHAAVVADEGGEVADDRVAAEDGEGRRIRGWVVSSEEEDGEECNEREGEEEGGEGCDHLH